MPIWSEILAELSGRQTSDFDGVRRKYLVDLHRHTERNIILYASGWLQRESPPGLVSIGDEDMQAFMEVSQGLQGGGIDLILHSPGVSKESEHLFGRLPRGFILLRSILQHRGWDRLRQWKETYE